MKCPTVLMGTLLVPVKCIWRCHGLFHLTFHSIDTLVCPYATGRADIWNNGENNPTKIRTNDKSRART